MPNIKRIINNELKKYPKGSEVTQCREYGDSYVIFITQKDAKGRKWGSSSFPVIKKLNGEVTYLDMFELPQSGFSLVNYKSIKED